MNKILHVIALALVVKGGSAQAAGDCVELCDADFYLTASAASVQQLIEQGVDVNTRDDIGKSPLHWVAAAKPEVISALLAAGADANAKDQWDRTPLHFLAATGSVENIRLLLDAGAEVNAKTANDWTPLHGAAKFGSAETIVVLLKAGADVAAKTEMGESAFDLSPSNTKLVGTDALQLLREGR